MNRRKFIRNTVLASSGIIAVNRASLAAWNKYTPFEGDVVIIGAGAAGLYAGSLLQQAGVNFEILEASPVIGGRLAKLEGFADFPLDLGAEWLHGKKSIAGELVAQTNTKIVKDNSENYYWYNEKITKKLPRNVEAIFEKENLPDISYKELSRKSGFGQEYQHIVEGIAGDQGADASLLSAFWSVKEFENWNSGEVDFKFKKTYFDLIHENIAKNILHTVKLNTIVKEIDYSGDKVKVRDSKGQIREADKVIITVPITILQDGDIEFVPPLPDEKQNAIKKIGMGAGMKVFLKFRKKFYEENILGGATCAYYVDEKLGKDGVDNVLMAFVMGGQAERLSSLGSNGSITKVLLEELDLMFGGEASKQIMDSHVQNWTTHPFIKGAYSYSTVGIANAREISSETIAHKLFFAGEAMNINGHHQTVHGAMQTGEKAVMKILR